MGCTSERAYNPPAIASQKAADIRSTCAPCTVHVRT